MSTSLLFPLGPQEMEFLDITSIRDTRFGKFAKIPKVGEPSSSAGSAWSPLPGSEERSLSWATGPPPEPSKGHGCSCLKASPCP